MKSSVILIAVLFTILSCVHSSEKSNPVENTVAYPIGNDTIFNFEEETIGNLPAGFSATATGKATSIKWSVVNEGGNKVVSQQANNEGSCYNLLVFDKNSYRNFKATVKIKAVSGKEDQGGGLVWRYIDKDNYYIARYNPLENNFRFYRVVNGNRKQLKSVDAGIKSNEWFTMTIKMNGNDISCWLNGNKLIEISDDTFTSAGRIGFWTKADAVTYFDDLEIFKNQ
jgi:hypothetical protein